MKKRSVCVVGAGVIGLSSAVRIQETIPNVEVTLVADKFSPHTTSDGAAGFWGPHDLGNTPRTLMKKWTKETFDYLLSLIRSSDAGIVNAQLLSGYELSTVVEQDPDYKDTVLGFRLLSAEELKEFPSVKWGCFFTTVQIDVPCYLHWLMKRFKERGGQVECQTVSSISQLGKQHDIIVNCCGLRGGILGYDKGYDEELYPIRGQLIRVQAPWIKHFYFLLDKGKVTYLFPCTRNVVLGGTKQKDRWDEEVNVDDKRDIWKKVVNLVPSIQHAKVDDSWAGLRPVRSTIRLEAERRQMNNKAVWIVHNYGHGGSGVSLHWGCARRAVQLVDDCLHHLDTMSRL